VTGRETVRPVGTVRAQSGHCTAVGEHHGLELRDSPPGHLYLGCGSRTKHSAPPIKREFWFSPGELAARCKDIDF
jgi:hypothetical protein